MSYKVGDRVVVRPDLAGGRIYRMEDGSTSDAATMDMTELCGQTVTISGYTGGKYRVSGSPWNWTDGMFLGLEIDVCNPVSADGFCDLI